jgi:hypothetical protein
MPSHPNQSSFQPQESVNNNTNKRYKKMSFGGGLLATLLSFQEVSGWNVRSHQSLGTSTHFFCNFCEFREHQSTQRHTIWWPGWSDAACLKATFMLQLVGHVYQCLLAFSSATLESIWKCHNRNQHNHDAFWEHSHLGYQISPVGLLDDVIPYTSSLELKRTEHTRQRVWYVYDKGDVIPHS